MKDIDQQLAEDGHLDEEQAAFLEAVRTNKVVSVYYELHLLLYLGILLFTSGVGYFAYMNMGDIGHWVTMSLIAVGIVLGSLFIAKHARPYSNGQVQVDQVYFDYALLLVALLVITLFTYVQVYFDLVELLINWTSFLTAALLFVMAYRYDHRGLLSMGITALAAAVGISITTVDWATGDWVASRELYVTNMLLGAALTVLGQWSHWKGVKAHFRAVYQNFGLLLFYIGGITAIFDSEYPFVFAFLVLAASGVLSWYTWKKKAFLFFLYSNIACYIALSYFIVELLAETDAALLLVYYFPASCLLYIILMITNRKHFSHDTAADSV